LRECCYMILSPSFFDRPVLEVCPELLGKYLVMKKWTKEMSYMITEIEAYDGEEDQACHARFGKTTRNAPMFGPPGCWYVYLVYGMYRMLNIVTGPWKHPSAILIRGIAKLRDWDIEDWKWKRHDRLDWPGKITKTLRIDKRYNDKPASRKTWLRIEDRWTIVKSYTTTKRIGIEYAGEWKHKEWNFKLKQ
jgi:DNA-3-methyladenine glycosylase